MANNYQFSFSTFASALKTSIFHAWSKPEEVVVVVESPDVRDCIIAMDILSPLELLPRELIFPIIEHAPETIRLLRLASRAVQSKVDEYAYKREVIPLAEELRFFQSHSWWTDILVDVPAQKAALFELRLAFSLGKAANRIKRVCRGNEKHPSVYKLNSHSFLYDNCLKECFDRRIRKVWLFDVTDPKPLAAVSSVLEHFEFDRLSVTVKFLYFRIGVLMNHIIKRHKVQHLTISVSGDTDFCAESFLLDISSRIQSLHIWQSRFAKISRDKPFLLGAYSCDWGRTILEMFLKKLEKLLIENPHHSKYLTNENSQLLINYLPELEKKIWFEVTCENYEEAVSHITHASAVPHSRLIIKHADRENEPFYSNSS